MQTRMHPLPRPGSLTATPALLLAALLLPGCPATTCSCDWEGPVEWTLAEASQDGSMLYLSGTLRWEPCCEEASSFQVVFKLDLSGCATWSQETPVVGVRHTGDIPASAIQVEMPTAAGGTLVLAPSGCTNQIRLDVVASDSILVSQLPVGQMSDAAGTSLGEVFLQVDEARPK